MLQSVVVVLMLCCAVPWAAAQNVQTTEQCFAKCVPAISEEPVAKEPHEARLKELEAKRKGVTDPELLKKLDEEKEDEMARFDYKNEKTCHYICG